MDRMRIPEQALSAYESLTGMRVCVHDLHGAFGPVIAPGRRWHGGPWCRVAKSWPAFEQCRAFDIREIRSQLDQLRDGRTHRCHAGLIEWLVPVFDEDDPVAVLFAGQAEASDWVPDYEAPRSSVRLVGDLPRVNGEQAGAYLESLRMVGDRMLLWLRQTQVAPGQRSRAETIRVFVEQMHHHDPTMDQLAEILGLSTTRTAHVVRQATGQTFGQLLTDARLRTACDLLHHSELDVEQVAHRSGFNDQSQFHKIFKRHFAVTPSAWRKHQAI